MPRGVKPNVRVGRLIHKASCTLLIQRCTLSIQNPPVEPSYNAQDQVWSEVVLIGHIRVQGWMSMGDPRWCTLIELKTRVPRMELLMDAHKHSSTTRMRFGRLQRARTPSILQRVTINLGGPRLFGSIDCPREILCVLGRRKSYLAESPCPIQSLHMQSKSEVCQPRVTRMHLNSSLEALE